MNRRTLVLGSAGVGIGALTLAFLANEADRSGPVQDNTLVRTHSPVIGPADAAVTIVEFFDPSCEACRAMYLPVKQIMAAFPGETRLVIRYAPLHEGSDEAVRILEAARLQDKFVPVLEILLIEQPKWAVHGSPDLERAWRYAEQAGLDLSRAREDARSPSIEAVLQQDIADMKAVNLRGTPTFFVNGKALPSLGPQQLHSLVQAEVLEARRKGGKR